MTVFLEKYKIFYAAVPKTGCTSLKLAFFELENGFPFRSFWANGASKHIHNVGYRTRERSEFPEARIKDYHRIAFVREPIARLLSAYGNRVIHHQELSLNKAAAGLEEYKLEPTPDLDQFIDRFIDYRKAHSSILHHTLPSSDFLGMDPSYYHRIYTLSEMDQFASDMSERTGQEVKVGRSQTHGPKFKVEDLTTKQQQKIREFYKSDYEAFGAYF
ncbi:sulfotransferase family 2 domain-containing protein [Pseudophaeobacter sp.]|uniref:sulfotransferase family 2 domain-containing protein n=1 Tax=Pseudophaeobacter sp. TaxID=1971739 RepID=UPI00329A4593